MTLQFATVRSVARIVSGGDVVDPAAVLWREFERAELVMATHDRALAIAAQAHGLAVIGIE